MVYELVVSIIILNLIYEFIEVVFPVKKMKNSIKSFVLILVFKEICFLLKNLF